MSRQLMIKRFPMFDFVIGFLMLVFSLLIIVPFLYILAVSFSGGGESIGGDFFLIPKEFSLEGYQYLMSTSRFIQAIGNSVYVTIVGTFVNLLFSVTLAYALSKKFLPGRRFMMLLIFFTMLFSAGIIPNYLLVKSLGLLNSYWALILPGATNAFTIMVMKTFFQGLPESLEEAARMDGAGEIRILWSLVLPLSMPVMATFGLMFMVGHWNEFFGAVIYLSKSSMWTVQVLLRQMIVVGTSNINNEFSMNEKSAAQLGDTIKMAAIIISMIPIVAVYPFLQKHFAQGAMIGSIKE
ncbi:ABC transporter permease [Paenibacillus ferrarius]|uniref:ABC transporter permease n=1 Tax=Paenibacillus ferrarius TaxID=1469647 RepID=A0A1V4HCN6_9BACL|nr:carbohydrate ABC transporter permease [Paenibacillus ferrarius]OPH50513.1 ABC transporter permease [Paenibacillus ferrarius]